MSTAGTITATENSPTRKYAYGDHFSITFTDYQARGPRSNEYKRCCVTVSVPQVDTAYVLRTNDVDLARRFANAAWKLRHRDLKIWDGSLRIAMTRVHREVA